MTTTKRDLLNALATLLGATTYNDCLDARMPIFPTETGLITPPNYQARKNRLT
ncbi:hypothetical protein [Alcanivorax nanhaiticus]|uniref:hypothetical protein n=1 Tax=Alcanivorax nanhaiticus TaxID=1177154 RepID=UPI0012E0B386|nr:hypothetical protein [Alcanivorax nanhaiticus]